jgi:hypothetical protein
MKLAGIVLRGGVFASLIAAGAVPGTGKLALAEREQQGTIFSTTNSEARAEVVFCFGCVLVCRADEALCRLRVCALGTVDGWVA